jgi:hypothetical protein
VHATAAATTSEVYSTAAATTNEVYAAAAATTNEVYAAAAATTSEVHATAAATTSEVYSTAAATTSEVYAAQRCTSTWTVVTYLAPYLARVLLGDVVAKRNFKVQLCVSCPESALQSQPPALTQEATHIKPNKNRINGTDPQNTDRLLGWLLSPPNVRAAQRHFGARLGAT